MDFLDLTSEAQLSQILENSYKKAQVIFKHSTRCIISSMALKRMHQCYEIEADCWVLDLLRHRDFSNFLAENFQVPHQSPQILVFHNGSLISHTSHEGIDGNFILKSYEKQ